MIKIYPIGGYSKIEGNSVLIKVDDQAVILDMGLTMDNYVKYQNEKIKISKEGNYKYNYDKLLKVDAVPNYYAVLNQLKYVKAIIPSHAHLDHIGAVPYGVKFFHNIQVLGTPYTIEFLKNEISSTRYNKSFKSKKIKLVSCKLNSSYKISEKITVEFIEITHSVPDSAMVAIHTPYGTILYAVDYKLDNYPQLGNPPNYQRLKELGESGIKCLILESLYADFNIETPSEEDVKSEINRILSSTDIEGKAIIVSTFSSHVARLKTLIDVGNKLGRKVYLVGRSLTTHSKIAQKLGIVNFKRNSTLVSRYDDINELLENVYSNRNSYFLICTGHQGEEFSVLSRILDNWFDYSFSKEDIMLFSSSVIPTELNQLSFSILEKKMKKLGLKIIKDVHASGHASLKDHEKILKILNPEYIIPAHAGHDKAKYLELLSKDIKIGKTILTKNGEVIELT